MDFTGIDIEDHKLIISHIGKNDQKFSTHILPLEKLSPDIVSKHTITTAALPSKDCIVKELRIEAPKRHLPKLLPFQLESLTSLSVDQQISIPYLIHSEKSLHHFAVFFTTKTAMESFETSLKQTIDLVPSFLTAPAIALAEFAKNFTDNPHGFLLHIREQETFFLSLSYFRPVIFRSFPIGSSLLHQNPEDFHNRCHQSLRIIFNKEQWNPSSLLITGLETSKFSPELQPFFTGKTSCSGNGSSKYALSIGLSLLSLQKNRGGDFSFKKLFPNTINRSSIFFKKVFMPASWILSFLFWGIFLYIFSLHQQALDQEFSSLSDLEERYFYNRPASLQQLQKRIKVSSKHFPYPLDALNVYDTLAILRNIVPLDAVEKFRYHMEKFPQKNTPHTPYKIKIFVQCKSPLSREDFLSSLKTHKIIDAHEEMTWKKEKDSTIITFYLNNRIHS
ncbi:MAG: hypothetical protein JW769_03420 [Parachlamydiales bacterium]|nr:hypothetical protein [Parachlamydiales bacterium]